MNHVLLNNKDISVLADITCILFKPFLGQNLDYSYCGLESAHIQFLNSSFSRYLLVPIIDMTYDR